MSKISVFILMLCCLMISCNGSVTDESAIPIRPVEWIENVWTQPVPEWGSPVRLSLPVPLDSIVLGPGGGFGAFGAHQGAHAEGLNHVWIPTKKGTPIKSWASGTVTKIEDMGDRGNGEHEYFVTINYGDGLVGKHIDMSTPVVTVGQAVQEGELVGHGPSAEFLLIDEYRTDGERWSNTKSGSPVSPFDYLKEPIKEQVIARHILKVVEPYFTKGQPVSNSRPWEPFLTNKMVFHKHHKNSVAGEWLLSNKGWKTPDPSYFDVMTIIDVTNTYGSFKRFVVSDSDWSLPGSKKNGLGSDGTWTISDGPGKIIFTQNGIVRYGLYTVEEGVERATLRLEWKTDSYPDAITSNAAVYVTRTNTYLYDDAQKIGVVQ